MIKPGKGESISEVFNTLADAQKTMVYIYIGAADSHKNDNSFPIGLAVTFEKMYSTLNEKQKKVVDYIVANCLSMIVKGENNA